MSGAIPALPAGEQAAPIDALLFDLGGVLIDWNPRHLFARHFPGNTAGMEDFLARVCPPEWNVSMDAGKPATVARAERVALFPEHTAMIDRWFDEWPAMLKGQLDDSVALLAALRERGYRLYALTNWSADTFPNALERFDFLSWFEDIVVSGRIGLAKPDPEIFRHAIHQCRLDPARTLFIDDSAKNTTAAAALGFQVHHFTDASTLGSRLAPLLAAPYA